ncbi:NAD(P)-binding protein [Mycena maculata]|uniref:NAD(P)-binding protein n=1 Tax=Mycena maculata TaxID=230809 RepID=A0AAD7JM34_9AGAR|nr:NAD(P)-binding protein [Mycena maculata]
MTISQDSSAPLAVLAGITGLQGGSVARALLESDKPYRIRGLTRDSTRPVAQAFAAQGIQIVGVLLTVDNEIAEGKMLVDITKDAGVKLLIWSALESLSALSGGKFPGVAFFDAKGEVTDYAKQSGVPLAVVEAGYYATNIFEASYALKKQPDGSFVFGLPVPPTTVVPVIDVGHDYGLYVRAAIEDSTLGAGSEVQSGTLISFGEMVTTLAEVSGKKITYLELNRDAFIEATGMPEYGSMLADIFQAFAIYGCKSSHYGPKVITNPRLLARPLRSWADFLEVNPVQELLS